MKRWKPLVLRVVTIAAFLTVCGWPGADMHAGSLADIRERGVLRHLGIPYAHFVYQDEESIGGLDVELMRLFARHLGVRYQWIPTTWSEALGDLTGTRVRPDGDNVLLQGETGVRGDILANGLTILPWREKVVHYSVPTFPTGVWLMARADAAMAPIQPSGRDALEQRRQTEGPRFVPQVTLTTWIEASEAADQVQLEVRDNGTGIPEDISSRLFVPFFTTKDPDKGTGLGLSICKSIVEGFDGRIDFSSTEGEGTAFILSFPEDKPDRRSCG